MRWIDFSPWPTAYAEIDPTRRKPTFMGIVRWVVEAMVATTKARFDADRLDLNKRAGEYGGRHALGRKLSQRFGMTILVLNRRRENQAVFIAKRVEDEPRFVPKRSEIAADPVGSPPLYIGKRGEGATEYDFEVLLPYGLGVGAIDLREVRAIVDLLKPAGKTYRILQDGVVVDPSELTSDD